MGERTKRLVRVRSVVSAATVVAGVVMAVCMGGGSGSIFRGGGLGHRSTMSIDGDER